MVADGTSDAAAQVTVSSMAASVSRTATVAAASLEKRASATHIGMDNVVDAGIV